MADAQKEVLTQAEVDTVARCANERLVVPTLERFVVDLEYAHVGAGACKFTWRTAA